MAGTLYNLTIPSTSPTFKYLPNVTNDPTSGWQSACPTYVNTSNGQGSWVCDPDSAHITCTYRASVQLSFEGVGIYLFGNTTHGLGYDIILDGNSFPGNPRPDLGLLYSANGLKSGLHSITLTVRQPSPDNEYGYVTFTEAVVSASTGTTRGTVKKWVVDDKDSRISYTAPSGLLWTVENADPPFMKPDGLSSGFHQCDWVGAAATLSFKGVGISVYGMCASPMNYSTYVAGLTSPYTSYDGSINLYAANSTVQQRAGNCLRYFKTGLDGNSIHSLQLQIKDMGYLAVDWIEIFTVEGGNAGSGGPSKIAILAGAISGGIVLILALLTIYICVRRRKNTGPQEILTPLPHWDQGRHQFSSEPFMPQPSTLPSQMPVNPNTMPPWPQPQTLAPSTNHVAVGTGVGFGTTLSAASSAVPLVAPGLTSNPSYLSSNPSYLSSNPSYSGSGGGPGWPDSSTYRSTSYNNAPTVGAVGTMPTDSGSAPAYGIGSVGGRAASSNMAVEGAPSTGANSSQAGHYDSTIGHSTSASPPPPSYDQVQGTYPIPGIQTGR